MYMCHSPVFNAYPAGIYTFKIQIAFRNLNKTFTVMSEMSVEYISIIISLICFTFNFFKGTSKIGQDSRNMLFKIYTENKYLRGVGGGGGGGIFIKLK